MADHNSAKKRNFESHVKKKKGLRSSSSSSQPYVPTKWVRKKVDKKEKASVTS